MNSRWMPHFRTVAGKAAVVYVVIATLTLSGCSGSTAKVTGKVTYNGQPVTGGTITFAPVPSEGSNAPGAPASGEVQSDGSYTLGTQGAASGAVVGRNRVSYLGPPAPPAEPGSSTGGHRPPPAPYANLVPKQPEVDVKAGSNTIDIELGPPGAK